MISRLIFVAVGLLKMAPILNIAKKRSQSQSQKLRELRPRDRSREGHRGRIEVAGLISLLCAGLNWRVWAVRHWTLTTLREKLIKIGAKVVRHSRQVVFQMAEVAVPRELFRSILQAIDRLRLPSVAGG